MQDKELNFEEADSLLPNEIPNNIDLGVEETMVGKRLDLVLANSLDILPSRAFTAKLIANSHVMVNDKKVKPSYLLRVGDKIQVSLEYLRIRTLPPQAENIPLNIVYEDSEILVINKPAGLVVHPGAGINSGTLVNAVLHHCGQTLPSFEDTHARAGIVHRLDRDTSGIMVVAKTQVALTELSKQFAEHKQGRIYEALIVNTLTPPKGTIETWHGRSPQNRIKYTVLPENQGKFAKLSYSIIQTFLDAAVSHVECELFTGRTHQIRVQMRHKGAAVLGDPLYGTEPHKLMRHKEIWAKIKPYLQRQMLHARLLTILHPTSKKTCTFTAAPPDDFKAVLEALTETFSSQ